MLTQTPYYTTDSVNRQTVLARLARRAVFRALENIRWGVLEVVDNGESWIFGVDEGTTARALVRVRDADFYLRLLFGGSVGAGEAYADELWDTDDLTMVVRVMVANSRALQGLDNAGSRWAMKTIDRMVNITRTNTRAGSRRNIAAHYDLSNEFFSLWLDSRMMYSSAVFADEGASLEDASTCKLQKLCEMLDLQATDHLLEIGTGWGGMAIYAASKYGVRVTTTTISQAQFEEVRVRVKAAGLESSIEVLLKDYRDLTGQYDKIVSVEMVEAVGDQYVDSYFQKVESLLAPSGRFVMQAITIQDQQYASALQTVDFIKKHIFPGGFLPSVTRLVNAATQTESLRLIELDDIGLDYAKTLACWSEKFSSCAAEFETLGFDHRFQRLWQFYFSYCAGGFLEGVISNVQLAFRNQPAALQTH